MGVILLSTTNIINLLYKEDKETSTIAISKLDFETTRLFLEHHIKTDKELDKLSYQDTSLYYNNNLLLNNVNSFKKTKNNNFINITICIKKDLEICQDMVF